MPAASAISATSNPMLRARCATCRWSNGCRPDARQFADIWRIFATSDGVVFQSEQLVFRWAKDTFEVFRPTSRFNRGSLVDGRFYLTMPESGLNVLEGGAFRPLPGTASIGRENYPVVLRYDEHRLLVGTRFNGLFLYDGAALTPFPTDVDAIIKPGITLQGDRAAGRDDRSGDNWRRLRDHRSARPSAGWARPGARVAQQRGLWPGRRPRRRDLGGAGARDCPHRNALAGVVLRRLRRVPGRVQLSTARRHPLSRVAGRREVPAAGGAGRQRRPGDGAGRRQPVLVVRDDARSCRPASPGACRWPAPTGSTRFAAPVPCRCMRRPTARFAARPCWHRRSTRHDSGLDCSMVWRRSVGSTVGGSTRDA